jgi:hypothetical protein
MTQLTANGQSNTKTNLLDEFEKILAERRSQAFRVATKEEEADRERNRNVLETVSQYTADGIVRGLADLQLDFGAIVSGLATRLTGETDKLGDLRRGIAVETERLQTLRQSRIVADTLYLRNQEHQSTLRSLEQEAAQNRETLDQEIAATRKQWEQEQTGFTVNTSESSDLLGQERQRQEADYAYETERSRKIATDEYEETQRQTERHLQETATLKEKDWAERDRVLAANQAKLQEFQQKIAVFPAELEEAIKKSREDGIRDANQDAKTKADLLAKEWDANQQRYTLQIQSLEAKIDKQTEQIADLASQLQATLRQSQDLALRAFDRPSTRATTRPPAAE